MYALIELVTTSDSDTGIEERFEAILGAAMEDGLILDATLAQNEQQRQELWKLRENAPRSQKMEGASIKHDVSVPIASLSAFYEAAAEAIRKIDKKAGSSPSAMWETARCITMCQSRKVEIPKPSSIVGKNTIGPFTTSLYPSAVQSAPSTASAD